jgi:hypothetical protein
MDVGLDSSGMYVVGFQNNEALWRVEKRSLTDGSLIWEKAVDLTGGDDVAHGTTVDPSGAYISGYQNSWAVWRVEKRELGTVCTPNCGSCSGGIQTCTKADCSTYSQCCPSVNGGWSGWSDPAGFPDGAGGTCSKSCGSGTQSRTCTNPSPSCGGASCFGASSQSCNVQPCLSPTLVIIPSSASIKIGEKINFVALYDVDGPGGPQPEQEVTSLSDWSSNNPSIATIDNGSKKGEVTGKAIGNTQITATYSGITANANIGVSFKPWWREIIPW